MYGYTPEELDRIDYEDNPEGLLCGHCGQVARGYAVVNTQRVCHPNNPEAQDCYALALLVDATAKWVEASCAEQGVPVFIEDPETLQKIATLLGGKR
jgi:hypothetical protein